MDQVCEEVKDDTGMSVRCCKNSCLFFSTIDYKVAQGCCPEGSICLISGPCHWFLASCRRCLEINQEMRLNLPMRSLFFLHPACNRDIIGSFSSLSKATSPWFSTTC